MKKVFIALPVKRYLEPECENFLTSKVFTQNDTFFVDKYEVRRGSPNIYYQRYNLAQDFLNSDSDYMLYLDADQAVTSPENPIELMIQARKDIISPLIVRTICPHIPACCTFQQRKMFEKKEEYFEDFRRFPQDKPYEVYYPCGGLVLITRKVLEFVKKPFWPVFNSDGDLMGTDVGFFESARRLGFRSFIDPRIQCVHVGPYQYHPDDYHAIFDTGLLPKMCKEGEK